MELSFDTTFLIDLHRDIGSQKIGANDLWIGSTAMAAGVPLVTRNGKEFRRIPGLKVMTY